jgi:regulator of replication initiation timing
MEENIDDLSKQQTIQQRPKLVMCNLQQTYTNHFHICSTVFNETKEKRQVRAGSIATHRSD